MMTSDDSPRVFLPPPLIFAGLLAIGLFLDRYPVSIAAVEIVGYALASFGVGLIANAIGLFRSSKTRPEPWQPSSALVSRGVYRFTRNPMYLGMAMLSLGIALIFSSLVGSVMAVVAAVVIDRAVVTREEAYLKRRFGQDYLNYSRSVRRWL
jgi:protein-S-isoprenylcysteine O-methyltransferase Ste14